MGVGPTLFNITTNNLDEESENTITGFAGDTTLDGEVDVSAGKAISQTRTGWNSELVRRVQSLTETVARSCSSDDTKEPDTGWDPLLRGTWGSCAQQELNRAQQRSCSSSESKSDTGMNPQGCH